MDSDCNNNHCHDFLKLSSMGKDDDGDADQRSHAIIALDKNIEHALLNAKAIESWPDNVVARIDNRAVDEDVPWMSSFVFVASDRFREAVEAQAYGQAQFLPVHSRLVKKSRTKTRFWVVNWLESVSCMTVREVSLRRTITKEYEFHPEKIPQNISVFRPREKMEIVLVRSSFRDHLKSNNITGCQFYPIHWNT